MRPSRNAQSPARPTGRFAQTPLFKLLPPSLPMVERVKAVGPLTMGYQTRGDWEKYVGYVQSQNGNNPVAAKAQILGELGLYYGGVTIVQSITGAGVTAAGCPTTASPQTPNALQSFSHDATEVAGSSGTPGTAAPAAAP